MCLDDKCVLIAGVFSRYIEKSRTAARQLRIELDRIYPDYGVMAEMESKRESDRIDVAVIVTRTDSHFEIAKKFLQSGIQVICDKPLCLSLTEAKELKRLAEEKELILCLTHNYSGYAMVRHAARMVRNGDLGKFFRAIQAFFSTWERTLTNLHDL
jgi:predicted dehydrogenase